MSRSEFTAIAFQTADNVITVGNETAGADGDVAGRRQRIARPLRWGEIAVRDAGSDVNWRWHALF